MEPKLRGIMEKILDELLESESLDALSEYYDKWKPLIKSKEDAMFGDIIGTVQERFVSLMLNTVRREPAEAERHEFLGLIDRRAQEIKSRILMVASK